MKKVIVAIMALGMMVSAANAGMKYECWMYKDGKPWKMTYIVADSKSQAESKAVAKRVSIVGMVTLKERL